MALNKDAYLASTAPWDQYPAEQLLWQPTTKTFAAIVR
jgi:hypothetical protein